MSRMSGLMKRRGSNSSAESGSRDNSPVPSPLASPLTARRTLPKEGEIPGESSVRAKLNLLEERLKSSEFGGTRVIKSQQKQDAVIAAEPEAPAVVPVRGEEE